MNKAIVTSFHAYQPYGREFYRTMENFFCHQMKQYEDEYDVLYVLDSGWGLSIEGLPSKAVVIPSDVNLRYYDAYKKILFQIKEQCVLFMDNDMIVYRSGVLRSVFDKLEQYKVASIYDTIGEYTSEKLNGKSKFCLYLFAARMAFLRAYNNVDWGVMPWGETLSELTKTMIQDGVEPYELTEDKSSLYFDGTSGYGAPKHTGYYHIRAGSVPAVLLAYKKYDPEKYWEYIRHQPKNEFLRQFMWWYWMKDKLNEEIEEEFYEMLHEIDVSLKEWMDYEKDFIEFHGLS